ncbi:sensor histidine kinase [Clostridium lundense]|uniref:sensor histidine kinase n=1 Tax=Clostridium lundense TaxID=319475 RepID=UPI001A9A2C5C|nr:sensor histidine kinase [Clostridium lundense]
MKFKLLLLILIIVICMVFINFYTILQGRTVEKKYSNMINKMIVIDSVGKNITNSTFYFDKYFSSKTRSDYEEYLKFYDEARKQINSLEEDLNTDSLYILRDLENLLDSYRESGIDALQKFGRYEKTDKFYNDFVETKQISEYCNEYIYKLHNSYLNYNRNVYKVLDERNKLNNLITTILFFIITCNCIMIAFIFSKDITDPIEELVTNANKVSKGNFDIVKINKSGIYEIDILGEGFETMVKDINKLINTIQENAILEKKLKDQQMINLQVENMLKETQLKVLQSQINPHFLFNTLNCVTQTAIIEEACETEKLINSISQLLRYSLSMMDNQAYLKDEINIIKQYVYIQETRFGDRVKFNINVGKDLENIKIPGMSLQPLIENAFIHGIEPKEDGGVIDIDVYKEKNFCIIKIEDNGQGMDIETLNAILKKDDKEKHIGHTTGIGIKNVINRLKLFYNDEDVFHIESEEDKGTTIYIKIRRGEVN